jgi:hypothetical protein
MAAKKDAAWKHVTLEEPVAGNANLATPLTDKEDKQPCSSTAPFSEGQRESVENLRRATTEKGKEVAFPTLKLS